MGQASIYTSEDIARRTAEFEAANKRDHVRFALGTIVLIVGILGGTLLALSL